MRQKYRSGHYVPVAVHHYASWSVGLLVSLIMSPLVWMPTVAVAQVLPVFCDATTAMSLAWADVGGHAANTDLQQCMPPRVCHPPQSFVHAMLAIHDRTRFHAPTRHHRANFTVPSLRSATVADVSYTIRFSPPGSIPLYAKTQRLRL